MRRVVVTGMGIWSCIGQDLQTVTHNLKEGRSGIVFDADRLNYGLRSAIHGDVPRPNLKKLLDRRFRVNLPEDGEYAYMACKEAFQTALFTTDYADSNEVGIIWARDSSTKACIDANAIMEQEKDSTMIGPSAMFLSATSSVSMNLSTIFHLRGINFTIGSACSSSSHAIGIGSMLIKNGMQNVVVVGGSCETTDIGVSIVDATGALSHNNDNPTRACRPYDKDRDGFVHSGGAAALVLEEYDHALARGAHIFAEVIGYGFASNGIEDIANPSMDSEYLAMRHALEDANITPQDLDYINTHGTSTIIGDVIEAQALTRLLRNAKPWISSTKSMTGHECWMAGASEAVYSILMMQHGFVAPNINLENVIDEAKDLRIARETIYTEINTVLSNSSGMGGTNSAIVLKKV